MYYGTGFCKLFFEVTDFFEVEMTVEVVHIFRHHDGADGLGDGRCGVSVGHFCLLCIYSLLTTIDKNINTHW